MGKQQSSFVKIPHVFLLILFFCLLQAFLFSVKAQTKTITGTITDELHNPLIGVTIAVKGTGSGTVSDVNGNYSLNVLEGAILQFSYIGFISQTIPVNKENKMDVTLREDSQTLDEIVVVGYGVQKKSHLTGSVTKVDVTGIDNIPVSTVDQALQGRIAGVQIQNNTSEVGESASIRVRGMGSISADDSPLIIVDGFPVEGGLGIINPNDIESIEVLKDAASAAIYGSRAANGVIMITSKSGEIKKPKYTLKISSGIKEAYQLHPIMTSREYVEMRAKESNLLGTALPAQDFAFACIDNNTDWQQEGIRTSNISNINAAVSGGTNEVRYYVSGAYVNDRGIMPNNEYQRMNVRAKVDATLSKRVKVGINISPTYTTKERPSANFMDFYRTPSWMPVKHTAITSAITGAPIGSYAYGSQFNNKVYTGIDPITGLERTVTANPFSTANHNPKMILDTDRRYVDEYRLNTASYMAIELMNGLEFKTSDGFNVRYMEDNRYRDKDSRQDGITNRGYYQNALEIDLLSENTLTYLKKVGMHDFNVLLGFSVQKKTLSTAGIVGLDFPTDFIHTLNAAGSIALMEDGKRVSGTWKEEEALLSYYARLMYNYRDKYLFSASFRTDGSSKFGDKNRWAQFPSVSLGWRVSEEDFLHQYEWLNQLKLRASYGVTGNDRIVNYAKIDLLSSANYSLGTGTGNATAGMANNSSTLGNPYLQWEQTNEYNYGMDIYLFNRIVLALEYYYSITKSLLYKQAVSTITGYQDQWTNLGKVRNRGFEADLTTHNIQNRKFSWSTSFNLSLNRNKLLDLGGPAYLITSQGTDGGEMYIAKVGDPAIQFYGFKKLGIWKDQAEIDANPHHNSDQPGGLKVWNVDGDDKIDDNDMVPLGDPFPDFTYGITNTFKYRNFDFTFLFQGVQGVDVYNGDARYNESRKWNRNYVENRWIGPEYPGDGQTPYFTNGLNWMLTNHVIEDGSYIALRDITLGYTLSGRVCRKLGLTNLRIYVSGQNIAFWWSKEYRGVNPEARYKSELYASNPLIDGYQRGGFPLQRTLSLGLDLTF
jgi:TonB-linked SusC/RagA family outer membrane protein